MTSRILGPLCLLTALACARAPASGAARVAAAPSTDAAPRSSITPVMSAPSTTAPTSAAPSTSVSPPPVVPPIVVLPAPAHASELHMYAGAALWVIPSDELGFDAEVFAAPAVGTRVLVADADGYAGSATVQRIETTAGACELCGAAHVRFSVKWESTHRATRGTQIALSPAKLVSDPSKLRMWTYPHLPKAPGFSVPGAHAAVDLDGDGAPDLALGGRDIECNGAPTARKLPVTHTPCDFMGMSCTQRWARMTEGWRIIEQVTHGTCIHDGRMMAP